MTAPQPAAPPPQLRTPIDSVIAWTALVLDNAKGLDHGSADYLRASLASARTLLGSVSRALEPAPSRAAADGAAGCDEAASPDDDASGFALLGRLRLAPGPFCVADVADDVTDILGSRADQSGVELVVDIRTDLLRTATVVGDPLRVRQACVELAKNAIEHTPQGGQVVVAFSASLLPAAAGAACSTEPEVVGGDCDCDRGEGSRAAPEEASQPLELEVTVQDTGAGVPVEKQAALLRCAGRESHTHRLSMAQAWLMPCRRVLPEACLCNPCSSHAHRCCFSPRLCVPHVQLPPPQAV